MVRIRKRSLAASSSGKQELPDSSHGGLHLYAGPKSNPSFQDPKLSSLLSPPSILKQRHSLLADSRYGVRTQRPATKQVPTEAAAVKSKPYSVLASICEVKPEKNDEGLIVAKRATTDHAQELEVKHIHMHDGADDDSAKCMDIKSASKEAGLASASASYTSKEVGTGDKADAPVKKAGHIHAPTCITQHPCSNSAMIADATDHPRKVLPLQLILMSTESRHLTAAKIPAHNINNNDKNVTSSGSTVSTPAKPKDTTHVQEKKVFPTWRKARALSSSAGGSLEHHLPEFAGVKLLQGESLKLTRDEDASRCTSDATLEPQVSSWQGHRRIRLADLNGAPDLLASVRPGVNVEVQQNKSTEKETGQITLDGEKKKAIQTKRKPAMKKQVETLDNTGNLLSLQTLKPSSTTSAAVLLFDGDLKKQESGSAKKIREAVAKRDQSLPPSVQDVPIPEELIGSVLGKPKAGSKTRKRAVINTDDDPEKTMNAVPVSHVASPSAAAHDHLQADSIRCRRKDGRRWQCKEQVVKPGAPFCHYHTLKMKEKQAASVIRRQIKQLKGEAEISNYAESTRSDKIKRARKRRRVWSSPNSMAMQGRYGAGMQCYAQEEGGEDEEEDAEGEEVKEEEEEEEKGQLVRAKLGKQQVKLLREAASLTTAKRRWRKKCKPCIRRLHDIHARARPATTDGLDFTNSFWVDTCTANKESPATRLPSPLPECLLNTDPNEWRSDFP